jgi:hypothetical protein
MRFLNPHQRDHCDTDSLHILLEFDARVVGDEYLKSSFDGGSEQNAFRRPSHRWARTVVASWALSSTAR